MGRDKARDDEFFNCNQEHERDYVAKQYPEHCEEVYDFLIQKCQNGQIHYSKHIDVYRLIERELGYPIP